jgi:hypothetical protein
MRLNVGSPLAGGPFCNGSSARQPASAEAPARHSKPLDGFDGLTASTLGALSLPAVSQTLSLSNGSLSNPSKRRRPYTPFGDCRHHSQGVVQLHESGWACRVGD